MLKTIRRWVSWKDKNGDWIIWKPLLFLFILIAVFVIFSFTMCYGTSTGNATIIIDPSGSKWYGASNGAWGIKLPWQQVIHLHYAMDGLGFWGEGNDPYADMPAIHQNSFDMIDHTTDAMFRWSWKRENLMGLYERYQDFDMLKKDVMGSIVRDSVRNIVPQFTTEEIVKRRPEVEQAIIVELHRMILSKPSIADAIQIDSVEFELRNIKCPQEVMDSFTRIKVSENDIQTAMNEQKSAVVRSNTLKLQEEISAMGQANATIIRMRGTADAIEYLSNVTGKPKDELVTLQLVLETLQKMANSEGTNYWFLCWKDGMPFVFDISPEQTP